MGFRRRCSRQTQRRTRCVPAVAQDMSPTHSKLQRSRIWRCVPQAATNQGSSCPWVIDLGAIVGNLTTCDPRGQSGCDDEESLYSDDACECGRSCHPRSVAWFALQVPRSPFCGEAWTYAAL